MKKLILCFGIWGIGTLWGSCRGQTIELDNDTAMFRATFKIEGGGISGTAFLLTQEVTNKALLGTNTNSVALVLVTADHVLSQMNSSNATIYLRFKEGDAYKKMPVEFPIRANGTNLWSHHPKADVAAIRPSLTLGKVEIQSLPEKALADDQFLDDFKIHPGDELRVLGYPLGFEANDAGFPILRSGRIASFPLTPFTKYPTFLLDFQIFEGNSGGPVYILDRRYMDKSPTSVTIFKIMGLISEQEWHIDHLKSYGEESLKRQQLGIGIVIHAQAIKETVALLPPIQ